jgi:hypothetical protein
MKLYLSDITCHYTVNKEDNTVNFTTFDGKVHKRVIRQIMALIPCYEIVITFKNKAYIVR